jgi:plasmid maintenance system antidote protein VapI
MAAPNKLKEIARERGKSQVAVLAEEFEKHGTQTGVAKALGVSQSTVKYWLMSHGLTEKTVLVLRSTGYQLSPEGQQMIRSRA